MFARTENSVFQHKLIFLDELQQNCVYSQNILKISYLEQGLTFCATYFCHVPDLRKFSMFW